MLILLTALVVVGFILVRSWRAAKAHEQAIDAFSTTIPLGMPQSQASRMLARAADEHSGWRYRPEALSSGADVAALESPLTFGASNHIVYVVFDQDVVSAVLVRTVDTATLRPPEAPQDRVADPTLNVLKNFTRPPRP